MMLCMRSPSVFKEETVEQKEKLYRIVTYTYKRGRRRQLEKLFLTVLLNPYAYVCTFIVLMPNRY